MAADACVDEKQAMHGILLYFFQYSFISVKLVIQLQEEYTNMRTHGSRSRGEWCSA
jgi:hypothetical protein